METLEKILNKIKGIANIFIYIVVLFLLVVVYFKNNKIDNLEAELLKKPKIERIYTHTIDTITETKVIPKEIIRLDTVEIAKLDTMYQPLDLTSADSAQIAEAYNNLYLDYAEEKLYDDILKDDSLAYARLKEKVQFNKITKREFIYKDRTPIIKETTYEIDKTFSIIGGLSGNFEGISLGAGVVTNKNVVYTINYNPFNKTAGGSVYFPVFNF